MQERILTPDQYKDLSKKIIHAVDTRYRIIPLNSLKDPKYHLKAPIHITLKFEDDNVIASFDDIEAFSYADTASEALDQLCEEIMQIYEELLEDQDNLGPLPNKWFQYLEDIIECRKRRSYYEVF